MTNFILEASPILCASGIGYLIGGFTGAVWGCVAITGIYTISLFVLMMAS